LEYLREAATAQALPGGCYEERGEHGDMPELSIAMKFAASAAVLEAWLHEVHALVK
jgi:hypothetical protein